MYKANRLVITKNQPRKGIIHDVFQCSSDNFIKHFIYRCIYEDHAPIVYFGTISLMWHASSQNHLIMPRNVREDSKSISVSSEEMKQICVDICSLSNENRFECLIAYIDYFSKWYEAKLNHYKPTTWFCV